MSMEVLVTVVREGSFTRAAEKLRISKAMVSKHIKRLEDDLGVRLLNRSTHRVSVTDSGRVFSERCREILAEVQEAEGVLRDFDRTPRGILRIAAPPTLGAMHISPALGEYIERYPDMRVELTLRETPQDPLEEGLDVVVWVGELRESNYIARRLTATRMLACAAPAYLSAHTPPTTVQDLANHNCLLIESYREWIFNVNGKPTPCRVTGSFRTTVANAVRQVALRGLGIAYLPSYIVGEDIRAGRLVGLFPNLTPIERPIYAIYPHRRHLSAKVQTAVELLSSRLEDTIGRFNALELNKAA